MSTPDPVVRALEVVDTELRGALYRTGNPRYRAELAVVARQRERMTLARMEESARGWARSARFMATLE